MCWLFRLNWSLLFSHKKSEKVVWKSCVWITIEKIFSKLHDTFQQVLCNPKTFNEAVPRITHLLTFDRKIKRRYKNSTLYCGYIIRSCVCEITGSSRHVKKHYTRCHEVKSRNIDNAAAVAKAPRVKTVRIQCESRATFCFSCLEKTHVGV